MTIKLRTGLLFDFCTQASVSDLFLVFFFLHTFYNFFFYTNMYIGFTPTTSVSSMDILGQRYLAP